MCVHNRTSTCVSVCPRVCVCIFIPEIFIVNIYHPAAALLQQREKNESVFVCLRVCTTSPSARSAVARELLFTSTVCVAAVRSGMQQEINVFPACELARTRARANKSNGGDGSGVVVGAHAYSRENAESLSVRRARAPKCWTNIYV